MPFSVTEGGKYVAHVLLKHKPKKAIVFVRTRGLVISFIISSDHRHHYHDVDHSLV